MVDMLTVRPPTQEELSLIDAAVKKTTRVTTYGGLTLYAIALCTGVTLMLNAGSSYESVILIIMFSVVGFSLFFYYLLRMYRTDPQEAKIAKYRGIASQRISGGGMPGAPKIGDRTVNLPSEWPFVWGAPMEVLCLETKTGQHLVYEMVYLNEFSINEAGKGHFCLQHDIDAGRLEIGGTHYALW